MSELSWIGIVICFLTVMALALLSSVMAGTGWESLKGRADLIKRVSIGILVISAGYWYVTVPYARSYYDFSDKLAYPRNGEQVADPEKYLRDHHLRIQSLESELKKQSEEFRQLQNHYEMVLQLACLAVLYFGVSVIFKKDDPPRHDLIKLDLHK